ncbi:transducin family protein / WD-40 repeat family protein [Striga asiatica]|uniref:Transducin family protein / WD-40 repeat family protein n=1 Tax=Striga asiatica TaxID=4170 RepID=A0A5A7Q9S1_STRAF|nr:transducin family protein / WD-40 repeat family protein [Striga asiatica]
MGISLQQTGIHLLSTDSTVIAIGWIDWDTCFAVGKQGFRFQASPPHSHEGEVEKSDASAFSPHTKAGTLNVESEDGIIPDWSLCVTTSHLSYTFDQGCLCEAIVKVHGVLPSSRWYSASSRRIQFHRVHVGDSGAVVIPFVQVATNATRNFVTLGQLELLPPFAGVSIQSN